MKKEAPSLFIGWSCLLNQNTH